MIIHIYHDSATFCIYYRTAPIDVVGFDHVYIRCLIYVMCIDVNIFEKLLEQLLLTPNDNDLWNPSVCFGRLEHGMSCGDVW
jgi:hypothetical protein